MSQTHAAQNVTAESFDAEVLQSGLPVLVDIWAAWCAPCRQIAPLVEQLAGEYEGRAKIVKLDMDAEREIGLRYEVQAIPTLLFFKGGELVDRFIGVKSKKDLADRLDQLIAG